MARIDMYVRHWQLLDWLGRSSRYVSITDLWLAFDRRWNKKTLLRDMHALSVVFDIEVRHMHAHNVGHPEMRFLLQKRPALPAPKDTLPLQPKQKQCSGPCGLVLPIEDFHRCWSQPDGRRPACKLCVNADGRAYYADNRERLRAQTRKRRRKFDLRRRQSRQSRTDAVSSGS